MGASRNKKSWKSTEHDRKEREREKQRRLRDLENGIGPGVSRMDSHRGPSGELLI